MTKKQKNNLLIEFVGLPGAGKTTICNAITMAHAKRGGLRLAGLSPTWAFFPLFFWVMLLGITARPFSFNRIIRCFKLPIFVLRYHTQRHWPIVLEQGFVQEMWSILFATSRYRAVYLYRAFQAIKPFCPDYLVWLETPSDIAVSRIVSREHGGSRFDGLPAKKVANMLQPQQDLLHELADLFVQQTDTQMLVLEGTLSAAENGQKIDTLLAEASATEKRPSYMFVTDNLAGGGAQRVFIALLNQCHLHQRKAELVLLKGTGIGFKEDFKRLKPKVLLKNPPTRFWAGARTTFVATVLLYRYICKQRPHVVISTQVPSNIITLLVGRFMFWQRPRIIIREANTLSTRARGLGRGAMLLLRLAKMTYPWADMVIAPSHGVAQDLIKNVGVPAKKVRVIYNPTVPANLDELTAQKVEHPFIKKIRGPLFVAVGRLGQAKGFDTLLKAFAQVYATQAGARLIILGEGDDRHKLEALRHKLGLDEVVSMPGFIENPFPYMKAADVFVLSSRWEGLPNVLIQAIACGATPVATRCPSGPDEILADGKYGYLVPVENIIALAEGMQNALKKPIPASKLHECAQAFNETLIFKQYEQALDNAP